MEQKILMWPVIVPTLSGMDTSSFAIYFFDNWNLINGSISKHVELIPVEWFRIFSYGNGIRRKGQREEGGKMRLYGGCGDGVGSKYGAWKMGKGLGSR